MKFLGNSVSNKRKILLFLAYLIAIVIGMTVIHEIGHLLAALALGIPLNEINIGLVKGIPGITLPDRFSNAPLAIVHYAGGFFAAGVLISIYFLIWHRRYRIQPSLFLWALGLITMTFVGAEIGNAIVEGHFHAAYIYYASSPSSATNIMIVFFGAMGFMLHFLFFNISKMKNRKDKAESQKSKLFYLHISSYYCRQFLFTII